MTQVIQDVTRGSLKVNNLPDRVCIRSWREFIESIPGFITVEVPASVSNVVIGNTAPGEDDIDKLWLRRDSSGTFLGLYVFQGGEWVLITPPPETVWWFQGTSADPPNGYTVILTGDPVVDPDVVQALIPRYVAGPGNTYKYYAARYTGF